MIQWRDGKTLPEQTQSTVTLSEGDAYEKFEQLRINSLKREFNTELLPHLNLVTRFAHSVNTDNNDIKEDDLSGRNNKFVNTTISAIDRSIMAMVSSGNNIFD